MGVYGFCRFVSITRSVVSPSVLVVVVVVVCQFPFGCSSAVCGSRSLSVGVNFPATRAAVVSCRFLSMVLRFGRFWFVAVFRQFLTVAWSWFVVAFFCQLFIAGSGLPVFGGFRQSSCCLSDGVPLTYFVNFGAAADYYFPIYIKKYKPIRITVSGGGEIRSRIRAGKLPAS